MSPMRLIILLIAAGAAIAAVFLVRSVQAPSPAAASAVAPQAAPPPPPTKHILVAKRPLPVGQFVVVEDLAWQEWPDNAPTPSFLDQKTSPDALEKAAGAVVRTPLAEGEPITLEKIVHPGDRGFMAAMMQPGMRAVSIEISAETAAGGFIQPDDHVDVVVTRESDGKFGGNTIANIHSDMILTNVRVLAIDAVYGPPPAQGVAAPIVGTRATLELTDADAILLNTAKKAGEIALVLRSITELQERSGVTAVGRVYRDGLKTAPEPVKVYRYGTETVTTVPAG